MEKDNEEYIEVEKVYDKKDGTFRYTAFPNALRIDIIYKLVKNTEASSEEYLLEGTVPVRGKSGRSYSMPHDQDIIDQLLQLPPGSQLIFQYQVAQLPDGAMGYAERSLYDGKARVFRDHYGLDEIFFDIVQLELSFDPTVTIHTGGTD